jgi:UDP-N-acetylmuramoylalanine--D-glutamate ligase
MSPARNVLIMGLGLHGGGAGAANYFVSHGDRVVVTDLKSKAQLAWGIEKLIEKDKIRFALGGHEYRDFKNADLVIKNPAVPKDSPYLAYAREHGATVDTDVGVFLDCIRKKTDNIIGVTGTKGKSTTASLIYAVLRKQYHALLAGNITVSVFDILPMVARSTYVVLELSSFQLGGIEGKEFSPRVGVFTNFMEDHLDYYTDMDEYFSDKACLYRFQHEGDTLVVNRDDDVFRRVDPPGGVRLFSFGLGREFTGSGVFVKKEPGSDVLYFRTQSTDYRLFDTTGIHLPGIHNLYNVLGAVTACFSEGIHPRVLRDAISDFRGLPHRLEYIGVRGGVQFVNDSAATVPAAAIRGINSIDGNITLIAGGFDKGLDLRDFIQVMREKVSHLVLLDGSGTGRLIKEGLDRDYVIYDDFKEAVLYAYGISSQGDTVLMSPGFASFGMFKNEFDRGNQFKEIVRSL